MATEQQKRKKLIGDTIAILDKKTQKGSLLERFVPLFFQNISLEDLEHTDDLSRLKAAESIFNLAKKRPKKQHLISVTNPTKKSSGWEPKRTVINIINDNMPFIIDSITAELTRRNFQIHMIVHPMVRIKRSPKGEMIDLASLDDKTPDLMAESFVHIQLTRQVAPSTLKSLEKSFDEILTQVRLATTDWQEMLKRMSSAAIDLQGAKSLIEKHNNVDAHEIDEAVEFLHYLGDNHFTLLGYREYLLKGDKAIVAPDSGLGILQEDSFSIFDGYRNIKDLPPEVQKFRREPKPLAIRKATRRSLVHRHVPMDVIITKKYDAKGNVIGERVFLGLFTSTLYSHSVQLIPFIRHKVANILERTKLRPASHDYKAMVDILEKFPRDEMFQISEDTLLEISSSILALKERKRVAFFYRIDDFERFVTCMVYLPRDRYGTALRLKVQKLLEERIGGTCTDFYTTVSENILARVIYIIKTDAGQINKFSQKKIESELVEITRSWIDRLRLALIGEYGDAKGAELSKAYRAAFSETYQIDTRIVSAVIDIDLVEKVIKTNKLALDLFNPTPKQTDILNLKLYSPGEPLPLSDVLPILENMGLFIITEKAYRVTPEHSKQDVWIHDFSMRMREGIVPNLEKVRGNFLQALEKIWYGEIENDPLNRLILSSGLNWAEINIVRTYARYIRQGNLPYGREYIEQTLYQQPEIVGLLVNFFHARLDPKHAKGRSAKIKDTEQKILRALDSVSKLDQDTILRAIYQTIQHTLRTNCYLTKRVGESEGCLAIKINSRELSFLPLPRPFVEIFVFGAHVEGIHLRGGKIARGGLRWSDRPDDFRTEVLGLMKAQMVKNAVIVPVGAKGGFVVKKPPHDGGRDAFLAEGVRCYKAFVASLLDVTDNIIDGKIVPPKNTVRHDGDDPYLVVAADKGTATFSDIANGLSGKYGFWLGDAFASGGSAGYDHKAMGITAKGAWESVKRHFRELGRDIQEQEFTVVGVGDMSGDVFGNGLLRSRKTRLLAAFNHMHIFIDPNPDTEKSFVERERLFNLPRSTWADYDRKILSKGGQIYERSAKSLKLTPEIKNLLGLSKEDISPNELIRILLTFKVDLLFFGGIGTYVKASHESHADVGDKHNDLLRVNGGDLRALVIGEGANLGMTQNARIEYARKGGRLNADFIDNSAGVDTSDHEVNIKILMQDIIRDTKMTQNARNKLLSNMTDAVEKLVLRNNYQQTQALTLTQSKAASYLHTHIDYIRTLEKTGLLKRSVEALPDDEEIKSRTVNKEGLFRPELCVLTSYSKIKLFNDLLESSLPDSADITTWLVNYFPDTLGKKYKPFILNHQLRRQIVATELANSICNRMGPVFVKSKREKTGAQVEDVARAYIIVKDVADLVDLWDQTEKLDNKVHADIQSDIMIDISRMADRLITWLLLHGDKPLDIDANRTHFTDKFRKLCQVLPKCLPGEQLRSIEARRKSLEKEGVPTALATRVAQFPALASSFEIIRISHISGASVEKIADIYYALGNRFGIDWLRAQVKSLKSTDYWPSIALNGIVDDFFHCQAELALRIIRERPADQPLESAPVKQMIKYWVDRHAGLVQQIDQHITIMKRDKKIDLSMMTIADQKIRTLSGM